MSRYYFATDDLDRKGADLIVELPGRKILIDLKIRNDDPRRWGEDDLAVELYSVLEKKIRGYQNQKCDYLLWVFAESGRAVLVPFAEFRRFHAANFDFWLKWRAEPPQKTVFRTGTTYSSVHCYVPFRMVKPIAREAAAA